VRASYRKYLLRGEKFLYENSDHTHFMDNVRRLVVSSKRTDATVLISAVR